MSRRTLPIDERNMGVTVSASGARIRPIDGAHARAMLNRLGETVPQEADLAWGAHEDNDTLIGVAMLGIGVHRGEAVVAVVPERRRLKVGGDLLHQLLEQAQASDLRYLVCTRSDPSISTDQFLRSQGLVVARHVGQGTLRIVAVLPCAPADR